MSASTIVIIMRGRLSVIKDGPETSPSNNFNEEVQMKVRIDYDLCMGDRNCNKVCPEVFEYDEDQMVSRVLVDEVPEHLEKLVLKAADECAPKAIVVED
jgi:ferredoxin